MNFVYLKTYLQLTNVTMQQIRDWMLPVAAARLLEKVPGEEEELIKNINMELAQREKQ